MNIDISLIALIILSFLLILVLAYAYHQRQQARFGVIEQPKQGAYKNKKSSWWYRNLYTTDLPDVAIYGESDKKQTFEHPAVITSEYPIAQQLHTGHLNENSYPYQAKASLLSTTESTLFLALHQILQNQPYILLAKVHLAEVLETLADVGDIKTRRTALERLRQKRLDFVICHQQSFAVCGVVAIEEPFDANKPLSTQLHDKFVDIALETAKIPMMHVIVSETYDLTSLKQQLMDNLQLNLFTTSQPTTATPATKTCPQCGEPMKRVSPKTGQHAGKTFFMCSQYPACKTVVHA
ncbi:topoisomerase-like C4 zinc finger-containing protein [Beggiatoa alba B18LD]|uniref:Topoisomerase-like C4 zinc finger-containing protein n=1 Tax=Beggiatoa alba B18LD TaxID=395493 RepID=I3CK94_9GAMM|nr:DUF2726 domain-containing protein [Beggiatoa alba]EIJ44037.1 topoisomerase-like C4 zinc finger-containing protein [Beggiatoa alba B18LD]